MPTSELIMGISSVDVAEPDDLMTIEIDQLYDAIAQALAEVGYILLEDALPPALMAELAAYLRQQEATLVPAGVGRRGDYQRDVRVRGDAIQWLEPDAPAVAGFLDWMDDLRVAINQRLFLGLFDYESHYAVYAPGAFYQKHRDAFHGKPGRKLSSVLYLNSEWNAQWGGELVLYSESGEEELERITPQYGRLVLFLSEDFPHEVLPARVERRSIAGWFRIKP